MTGKQQAFADEWLTGAATGKQFNARAAAEHAGYTLTETNPYSTGSKLLRHPEVKAYIDKAMKSQSMSAMEVLGRFTEIARAEIGDVVTKDDVTGRLKIDPDAVIENKKFIKAFGFDSNGNPKIDFHDTMQALRDIARVLGMMKDGLEVSGPGGGAVPVAVQVQFVRADGTTPSVGTESPDNDTQATEEDFSDLE